MVNTVKTVQHHLVSGKEGRCNCTLCFSFFSKMSVRSNFIRVVKWQVTWTALKTALQPRSVGRHIANTHVGRSCLFVQQLKQFFRGHNFRPFVFNHRKIVRVTGYDVVCMACLSQFQ